MPTVWLARWFAVAALLASLVACRGKGPAAPAPAPPVGTGELRQQAYAQEVYDYPETRELVGLVNDAAKLVQRKGEAAFDDFRVPGSKWRQEETYIFVLDPAGTMLVHVDPAMERKNQLDLKDINGRPIIRELIVTAARRGGLARRGATTHARARGWRWFSPARAAPAGAAAAAR